MTNVLRRTWKRHAWNITFFVIIVAVCIWIGRASSAEAKQVEFLDQKPEQYIIAKPALTTTTTTTTTFKPVITTPKPRVEVAPPGPGDEIYHRLAACESGDPTYNGSSGYDGAFQFSPPTWNSMGTGYAFAYEAPFDVQLDAAKRLIARSGWGQFPACARQLGML